MPDNDLNNLDRQSIDKQYESTCTEGDAPSPEAEQIGPPVDFITFISSLSANAMYHLGLIRPPDMPDIPVNMPMARYTIDLIGMLRDKTQGNLPKAEKQFIDGIVYDLRLKFLNTCRSRSD